MNEQERIEAMVREGRITRDEADRLLNVLSDMDEFEAELGSVDDRVAAVNRPDGEEVAPGPVQAGGSGNAMASGSETTAAAETSAAQREAQANGEASAGSRAESGSGIGTRNGPEAGGGPVGDKQQRTAGAGTGSSAYRELRWVDVELMAGDLRVTVDESLTAPVASTQGEGTTELDATEDGYRYRGTANSTDEGFLGRFIGSVRAGRTDLAIPAGYGLRLEMKAGHIDITGPIPFLEGHLLAADLDARELHGVDLTVSAGDVDLALQVSEGENRIKAVAGDLNVRLLRGSDVTVSGRVSIGDLSLPRAWRHQSRGLGNDFEHSLGEGRGKLRIELGTGDLDVEADRE